MEVNDIMSGDCSLCYYSDPKATITQQTSCSLPEEVRPDVEAVIWAPPQLSPDPPLPPPHPHPSTLSPSPTPKHAVIQIFIWSCDVDRSIEPNESSLWCSCQSRLGLESVYLTGRDIPTIFLANPRHLGVNYFTNLSKWHAIVPSVSISSPLFLNLRWLGSRRWVQKGSNKAWDFMFTQMWESPHK